MIVITKVSNIFSSSLGIYMHLFHLCLINKYNWIDSYFLFFFEFTPIRKFFVIFDDSLKHKLIPSQGWPLQGNFYFWMPLYIFKTCGY